MDAIAQDRLIRIDAHRDAANDWSMARFRAPDALIAAGIRSYTDYDETTGGFTARRELPGLSPVFLVNLGDPIAIVAGDGEEVTLRAGEGFIAATHVRPAVSRSTGRQSGVSVALSMAALRALLETPIHELLDRAVPLDRIGGAWGRRLGAALAEAGTRAERVARLDAALAFRLRDKPVGNPAVTHAMAMLMRGDAVAETAREIGWSRKHLSVRVREAAGVEPRMVRRLARFGRLVERIDPAAAPDWAGMAADAGYYDQPHMLRDFRDFAGLTPREFIARSIPGGGGLIEA